MVSAFSSETTKPKKREDITQESSPSISSRSLDDQDAMHLLSAYSTYHTARRTHSSVVTGSTLAGRFGKWTRSAKIRPFSLKSCSSNKDCHGEEHAEKQARLAHILGAVPTQPRTTPSMCHCHSARQLSSHLAGHCRHLRRYSGARKHLSQESYGRRSAGR